MQNNFMNRSLNYVIIVAATALLQFFLPWWIIAVVPFIVYLVRPDSPLIAYGISLAAVSTVWATYAAFLHNTTQGSMSNRIAEIFYLPNGTMLLLAVTFLSGLVAGFSGSAGALMRQVFVRERH